MVTDQDLQLRPPKILSWEPQARGRRGHRLPRSDAKGHRKGHPRDVSLRQQPLVLYAVVPLRWDHDGWHLRFSPVTSQSQGGKAGGGASKSYYE